MCSQLCVNDFQTALDALCVRMVLPPAPPAAPAPVAPALPAPAAMRPPAPPAAPPPAEVTTEITDLIQRLEQVELTIGELGRLEQVEHAIVELRELGERVERDCSVLRGMVEELLQASRRTSSSSMSDSDQIMVLESSVISVNAMTIAAGTSSSTNGSGHQSAVEQPAFSDMPHQSSIVDE